MREGWRETTLGTFLEEISRPVQVTELDEVRYAGVRLYTEGVYAREPVPASEVKTKTLTELRQGDVTYNRMWATKASFGVAGEDVDGCHVTNDFPIFRIDASQANAAYVEQLFKTPRFQADAASRATGTTERRRLKQRDFLAIPTTLPPLHEQRRIVDLIAAVDDAIEAAEGEAGAAAAARRSVWSSVATRHVPVSAVGDVTQGRSLPKDLQGVVAGDISWFKIADMTGPGNAFGYAVAETRVSANVLTERGGRITAAGSVAFPRVGAAVATEKKRVLEVDAALDENHIAVTPKAGGQSEILLAAFDSIRLGGLVRKGAVPSLNMGVIRTLEIPWPPEGANLAEVDGLLSAMRAAERSARDTADALRALRSNLLTVLLSGEHEIPASYDALLEEVA